MTVATSLISTLCSSLTREIKRVSCRRSELRECSHFSGICSHCLCALNYVCGSPSSFSFNFEPSASWSFYEMYSKHTLDSRRTVVGYAVYWPYFGKCFLWFWPITNDIKTWWVRVPTTCVSFGSNPSVFRELSSSQDFHGRRWLTLTLESVTF